MKRGIPKEERRRIVELSMIRGNCVPVQRGILQEKKLTRERKNKGKGSE